MSSVTRPVRIESMSDDDVLSIGRTALDYKSAHDELACIRHRAKRLCDTMEESAKQLRATLDGHHVSGGRPSDDARELMQAIHTAKSRCAELRSRLVDLGIPMGSE